MVGQCVFWISLAPEGSKCTDLAVSQGWPKRMLSRTVARWIHGFWSTRHPERKACGTAEYIALYNTVLYNAMCNARDWGKGQAAPYKQRVPQSSDPRPPYPLDTPPARQQQGTPLPFLCLQRHHPLRRQLAPPTLPPSAVTSATTSEARTEVATCALLSQRQRHSMAPGGKLPAPPVALRAELTCRRQPTIQGVPLGEPA